MTVALPKTRPSDILDLTTAMHRAATALAQKCGCGRPNCTIGEHVWRATRDGTPGLKAHAYDNTPTRHTGHNTPDPRTHHGPDTTDHDNLAHIARRLTRDVDALEILVGNWRPDRRRGDDAPSATDEDWCRHHLATLGTCEPRYRGDLCRRCYDFQLGTKGKAHPAGYLPAKPILEAWHRGEKVTTKMVADLAPRKKKRKRRRGR